MFVRKLVVIVLPLLALCGLLALAGPMQRMDSWGEAGFSVLTGLAVSLIPMLAGERRARLPFTRQLWVPAALLLILMVLQSFAMHGAIGWLPEPLDRPDTLAYLLEGVLCGALAGRAIRG